MLIPEYFSTSLPLGKADSFRRYYYKKWIETESHTYTALGSHLNHEWKSSYFTSDKHRPTNFSHARIEGIASWNYRYYKAFNQDTQTQFKDWASFANCIYSRTGTNDKDSAPLFIGGASIVNQKKFSPDARVTLFEGPIRGAINAADNRFLEKINNNSTELGAMVVELGETVSWFTGYAVGLANFAKAVYTGRWNKALKPLRISKKSWNARNKRIDQSVAGRWLEWSFAVKPLVSDVAKLAETWASPLDALKALTYITTATENFSGSAKTWIRVNTTSYARVVDASWQGKIRVSANWAVADHEAVARNALGLNAAAPALWEGVPFSWLLDYVVNIGDFLANLSATTGLQFLHGYRSFKIIQNDVFNYNPLASGDVLENRYSGKYKTEAYFRKIITSFPKSHLAFVLDDISITQVSYVASLCSLLTNFKRRL